MMIMSRSSYWCHANYMGMIVVFFMFALYVGNGFVGAVEAEELVVEIEGGYGYERWNDSVVGAVDAEELVVGMEGGYGYEKLSTVFVMGKLICQYHPCFPRTITRHPIPGASVAVICSHRSNGKKKRKWDRVEGMTDGFGDFIIDLPSRLHAIPNLERTCLVRVIQLPNNSPCSRPGFTGKHKGLVLLSARNGIRTYSAHTIYLTATRKTCPRRKKRYTYTDQE